MSTLALPTRHVMLCVARRTGRVRVGVCPDSWGSEATLHPNGFQPFLLSFGGISPLALRQCPNCLRAPWWIASSVLRVWLSGLLSLCLGHPLVHPPPRLVHAPAEYQLLARV